MVFSHIEDNRNRLKFSEHREWTGTSRENSIARVNEPEANPSGNRSCDVAVAKLRRCKLRLTKVVLDGPLILNHGLLLVIKNLLCNSVRSERFAVPPQINL